MQMAASAAGSAKLPGLPEFIVMMKPAANNSKQAVKEFPKFMVNCWIKDSAASAPASEAANPRQTNPFEHYPFVFDSETCKLFEDFNESKCRFSLQPSDLSQSKVIDYIKRYNAFYPQLTRPPDLALEEQIKSQDLSAVDLFLVCFCAGLRDTYCTENANNHELNSTLQLNFQRDYKGRKESTKGELQKDTADVDLPLNFKQYCKQMKPLPDSISCGPSRFLKGFVDTFLKPDSQDKAETRLHKERAFARMCSLLIFVFKEASCTRTNEEKAMLQMRQNALLVPLCFLPCVSVVCHKILYPENNKNQKFLSQTVTHTEQNDLRMMRPFHSLLGYVAVVPPTSGAQLNKHSEESETNREMVWDGLWKKFLPTVTDDNHFPSQFGQFTKMSLSDVKSFKHSDCSEGRYVSLLSHYVHLFLEAVRSDHACKKSMYSVHLDNLVCTIWAATMFPWVITQKAPVPSYQNTSDLVNVPFRRDFENLRCQAVPYLYDDLNPKNAPNNQIDAYDVAERFSLSISDEIHEFFLKLWSKLLNYVQAQAAKSKCQSEYSLYAILLLVSFFGLPWIQNSTLLHLCLAILTILTANVSVVFYYLWRMRLFPRSRSFSQMTRESTEAFFLHRWATDYSQWTMKSEHNLIASQAGFFEYLSRRLNNDMQDLKSALQKSGYMQWIDTLECLFHDSTASLTWVCSADSTFLKRSFLETFDHASQSINQAFAPSIVCIVDDQVSHKIFSGHCRDELPSRVQELSSFFRHHLRVGVIAESHVKRKKNLLEQVTDLEPFLKLFNVQSGIRPNDPDFVQTFHHLKRVFGEKWETNNVFGETGTNFVKTFAIIPAVSVKKTRQVAIQLSPNTINQSNKKYDIVFSNTATRDFLNDLIDFKNRHLSSLDNYISKSTYLVIGLRNSAGKTIMACVKFQNIEVDHTYAIHCKDVRLWEQENPIPGSHQPTNFALDFSVFVYAIKSSELLLQKSADDKANESMSFDFAQCLCSASPSIVVPPSKERFQTIVKQGHSFSDKLSFKISSHSTQFLEAFSEVHNRRSHEPIISNRFGKDMLLPSLYSPWVSRPAFPRPTLGSPFFLLFLMSKPGHRLGKPGEYLLDLRREDLDCYSRALGQLGSGLLDIRSSTISKLDPKILKERSFLLFKWQQVINKMPWIRLEPIPPRDVLFRTRICASALKDVSWWLSVSEGTSLVQNASTKCQPTNIAQIVTKSISAEVANLNEEISYLLRVQNLVEVTSLHLKMCCSALDQCVKVHKDEHFGHIPLWEFLNTYRSKGEIKGDRSQMKHICRHYLEKVSNLLLLAGFRSTSKNVQPIKYMDFRDQMMHRFKDSWNVSVSVSKKKEWLDSIQKGDTSGCCLGDFPNALSANWTLEASKLFQDVLGRLYDHSAALFLDSVKPDPIKQAGILQLINASKVPSEQMASFASFLPNWSSTKLPHRTFLHFPNKLGSDFSDVGFSKPQIDTPYDFLEELQKLLQEVHDFLNSNAMSLSLSTRMSLNFEILQNAILFMGARYADGDDSNSPGILQILEREWTGHAPETGLSKDLENTCRLVDQRLKICRSKILTLNGKAKRAQLLKEDLSYRQGHHAPQDAVRLLLWHVLDWYSQRFNEHWGFPTSCTLSSSSTTKDFCNAIDSDPTYLSIGETLEEFDKNHPYASTLLVTIYLLMLLMYWKFAGNLGYLYVGSSFFFVFTTWWLLRHRGKMNLPYFLARFRIIEPNDVHHGIDLAAWTNFVFFSILAVIALWYLGIIPLHPVSDATTILLPFLLMGFLICA